MQNYPNLVSYDIEVYHVVFWNEIITVEYPLYDK